MPTPDYRVPVRVARGTKAALDAGLTDLQEGELCYATDENGLYVIEGGVLTPTVPADLTGIEIINDTSPQLGGDLDVNGFDIISVSGPVDVGSATGELVVRGGSSEGKLTLNCTANTHGVSIQSPPHASSATYTLTLPDDTGTNGQALTTDGSGSLSWATPSAVGSIDDLSDVDTTTNAPSTGQGLVWDGTQWAPGDVSDVDLATSSIDDLSDVDTTTTAPTNDQVLAWNGTNWVPADQTGGGGGGGVTSIIAGTGISIDQATGDVTVTATGGGGGGASGASLVNSGNNVGGDYNNSPFVMSLGANLQAGDLAILQVNVRAGGDPNSIPGLAIPTGWTLAASQDYLGAATTADCQSNILYKYLDESDISAGSVSLSTTAPDPGDDWYTQRAVFRNAFLSSTTIADTSPEGSLPETGYDFTGISASAGGFNFVTATSLYAFATTSGIEVTPAGDRDLGWLNGSVTNDGYEEGVIRRIASLLGTGSLAFNIKALNASGSAVALTDGYHIMVANISFASPAITSIVGGTFGSGV